MSKSILRILSLSALFMIASCAGLTEDQARTKMNNEAESLSVIACDCINNLGNIEGDALIEAQADCSAEGQIKLIKLSHDEGIEEKYEKIEDEAIELYFKNIDDCKAQ